MDIITTSPRFDYEVISPVFGRGFSKDGLLASVNEETAFLEATNDIEEKAKRLGGDAVIGVKFVSEFDFTPNAKRTCNIYCFGTAVRKT